VVFLRFVASDEATRVSLSPSSAGNQEKVRTEGDSLPYSVIEKLDLVSPLRSERRYFSF
jgi:hypothetical protein